MLIGTQAGSLLVVLTSALMRHTMLLLATPEVTQALVDGVHRIAEFRLVAVALADGRVVGRAGLEIRIPGPVADQLAAAANHAAEHAGHAIIRLELPESRITPGTTHREAVDAPALHQ